MVNHYNVDIIFQYIEHPFQENILHQFFPYSSFMKSSLNWEVSFVHSNLFTGNFCETAQPYKLFTFQC